MPKLLNVALERNQLFYFLIPAVKEIFQIVKFLRDFISSSISSLNISAFYMSVPYKPVPYKKKACNRARTLAQCILQGDLPDPGLSIVYIRLSTSFDRLLFLEKKKSSPKNCGQLADYRPTPPRNVLKLRPRV